MRCPHSSLRTGTLLRSHLQPIALMRLPLSGTEGDMHVENLTRILVHQHIPELAGHGVR